MTQSSACSPTCAAVLPVLAELRPPLFLGGRSWWHLRLRNLSCYEALSVKQGALLAAGGRGSAVMEHLLLEVATTPLRLIAAKSEKSRSELGRFLAKQVRTRARGKMLRGPGRPLRACLAALRSTRCFKGREKRCLVTLAPSSGLAHGRDVRACLKRLKRAFCFLFWGTFPSPLTYPLAALWPRLVDVTFGNICSLFLCN